MRTTRLWLPLIWSVLLSGSWQGGLAYAQPVADRDLVIANHGKQTINELYASPSTVDDWGEDRLGDATIEPQRSFRLHIAHSRDCGFDFQVIYDDASREEMRNVNICQSRALAFDGAHALLPPGADGGLHHIAITDHAGRPIQQVLISPANAGDWGDDRLGAASLSVGDVATIDYVGECVADLRIVYDNRSAEERRGLDLCALGGVVVQPGWTTADSLLPVPMAATPDEALPVQVVNHAGHAASQLFVTPAGGAAATADLLGSTNLDDGAEVTVTVRRPRGVCRFDVHAVFGGKLPDQHLSVDLCAAPSITLAPRL